MKYIGVSYVSDSLHYNGTSLAEISTVLCRLFVAKKKPILNSDVLRK